MLSIARGGKTILFVSRQINTIRQLCDRVIVLSEGKVIFDGDVAKSNSENLDYIYPAFAFEVLHADGTGKPWPRAWGRCKFEDIDVKLLEN